MLARISSPLDLASQEVSNVVPLQESQAPDFAPVSLLLKQGVEEGVFPGAVLLVGRGNHIVFTESVGNKTFIGHHPMKEETVFDVAGLTAGIVTTTLFGQLLQQHRVGLHERVCRYLQSFGVLGKSPITLAHLLSHTSGLPAWHPFFQELLEAHGAARAGILTSKGAVDYILNSIVRWEHKAEIGVKYQYSDVGLILLGIIIELARGISLDRAFFRYICHPLGLKSTSFIDLSKLRQKGGLSPVTEMIAPTEECPWRERILCGEVHDDNAWAMGGIAGHSGLFSSVRDLHKVGSALQAAAQGRENHLIAPSVFRELLAGAELPGGQRVRYGWDSPTKENGMGDSGLSSEAFGYNGFTGCSFWVDPSKGIHVILLSNRVHPSRNNKKILNYRPKLYKAVFEALA